LPKQMSLQFSLEHQ